MCWRRSPASARTSAIRPLVTPTSQIVGTQAVMNVIAGERYKTFPKESKGTAAGRVRRSCPAR